jgi:NAD(P)-dependent dehydrogenase (short-subunit alcohol dehydrogenase family)
MTVSHDVHLQVNTIGTLVLFKASFGLLKASTSTPKFVVISSQGGGIEVGAAFPFETAPYGISKAAVNFLARKLHTEHAADGLGEPSLALDEMKPLLIRHDSGTSRIPSVPWSS